jgi:hypothetical protein
MKKMKVLLVVNIRMKMKVLNLTDSSRLKGLYDYTSLHTKD